MSSNNNTIYLDKFYTNLDIVDKCYDAIKKHVDIDKNDLIIEPSAGSGSFINIIKKLSNNYKFYDIKPENNEIIKKDFLELRIEDSKKTTTHIIGNPPFGIKSSRAIAFIKHATNILQAKSVSFILPISFKKSSQQKSFPPNYHLIHQITLPENSFTYFGVSKNIKTVFQIWVRKDKLRKIPKKLIPAPWYSFVKKEDSDISIRRVGSNIGHVKIREDIDNINTHWFIKTKNIKNISELLIKLNSINYNKDNNVGALSISKQDIIKNYNRYKERWI